MTQEEKDGKIADAKAEIRTAKDSLNKMRADLEKLQNTKVQKPKARNGRRS